MKKFLLLIMLIMTAMLSGCAKPQIIRIFPPEEATKMDLSSIIEDKNLNVDEKAQLIQMKMSEDVERKKRAVEAEKDNKLSSIINKPVTPLRTPDTILRVLLLPYEDENKVLNGWKYSYVKVDDGKWIMADYLNSTIPASRGMLVPLSDDNGITNRIKGVGYAPPINDADIKYTVKDYIKSKEIAEKEAKEQAKEETKRIRAEQKKAKELRAEAEKLRGKKTKEQQELEDLEKEVQQLKNEREKIKQLKLESLELKKNKSSKETKIEQDKKTTDKKIKQDIKDSKKEQQDEKTTSNEIKQDIRDSAKSDNKEIKNDVIENKGSIKGYQNSEGSLNEVIIIDSKDLSEPSEGNTKETNNKENLVENNKIVNDDKKITQEVKNDDKEHSQLKTHDISESNVNNMDNELKENNISIDGESKVEDMPSNTKGKIFRIN